MNPLRKWSETLSMVPGGRQTETFSNNLVAFHNPTSPSSEAYRMLCTNLFYAQVDDPPKVLAVTSSGPGEGKSVTCANLGIALSQMGKRVLLLDCDLRNPSQHNLFWSRKETGLVDVIAGQATLEQASHEPLPGLRVVPAGRIPSNPTEILGSRRFTEFLAWVREEYDYVLLDTPPVRLVSDSAILARHGDGVLLVLDAQNASKKSLRQAVKILGNVGARVIGTVMNRVKASRDEEGYGYLPRYYGRP